MGSRWSQERPFRLSGAGLAIALLGAGAIFAQPADLEFQVNTYTTEKQYVPVIARAANDDFVVVWASRGSPESDSEYTSVQARRFLADGTPLGLEFQVNTLTVGFQDQPDISMTDAGDFIIVWASSESAGTDSDGASIQARRYAADGTALSDEIQINTYTTDDQYYPVVALGEDGRAIVVWSSWGSSAGDQDRTSVQAQLLAPDGSLDGSEFQVNTYEADFQFHPDVGLSADGTAVVVWASLGSGGPDQDESSAQLQRYAPDGSPLGGEFQMNEFSTGWQWLPVVDVAPDGSFLVVWESEGSYGTDTAPSRSIQARFFDLNGVPIAGEFQVNSYTTGAQDDPAVDVASDGSFVVVWNSGRSAGSDDREFSVQRQRFMADGSPVGIQVQVNLYTLGSQEQADVSIASDGEFIVVWESEGSSGNDNDRESIQWRMSPMVTLFSDGFESGDTSAWETTHDPPDGQHPRQPR